MQSSSRTPGLAVLMAAVLDFTGALTGTAVAKTIAAGFTDPKMVSQVVVLAALSGQRPAQPQVAPNVHMHPSAQPVKQEAAV